MKIIALEGLDKSGKFTQCGLLEQNLKQRGYKVVRSEFHRYDTPTGELIMKWLKKEWNVSQYTIELLMAADKQAQQEWIYELDEQGYDFLILDRYTLSQHVYAVANGVDGRWTLDLQCHMRRPDIDIVIDIPSDVSMKRKGKHNDGINDKYESDLRLLEKVRENYKMFSTYYSAPIKHVVNGMNKVEKIHGDIVGIVNKELNLK